MSQLGPQPSARLVELRRAFDATFAAPPAIRSADVEDFLAIRVGQGHYALRVGALAGLVANRKVVPLPGADATVLGLAGIHGQLFPVYSLSLVLGQEERRQDRRWLAVVGQEEPVAVAFDELEGHLRVSPANVYVPQETPRDHFAQALRLDSGVRYVVNVSSIVAAVKQRGGAFAAATGR